MVHFKVNNVNPKQRRTGDCSTRALVGTLGISYEEAIRLQAETAIKTCYGLTDKQVMERILKQFGYVKIKQPKRLIGTHYYKYMVWEMDQLLTAEQMQEGVFITIAGHHTCIKEGYLQDTWDCRYKTVGNYYVKER